MKEQELSSLLRVTRQVFRILREQEQTGWLLDQEKARIRLLELQMEAEKLEQQIRPVLPMVLKPKSRRPTWPKDQFKKDGTPNVRALKYYGADHSRYRTDRIHDHEPLNLRNPQQVQEFLLTQGWVPTEWNYKKNAEGKKVRTSPKLTEDSFGSIKGETGQVIARLRQIWSRASDIERWLKNLRPDGRVPTPFSGKTVTHRLRHNIVVNVPGLDAFYGPQVRSLFIAPEGYKVVGCDSDSCQLRMLIHEMYNHGLNNKEFEHALLYGSKEDGTDAHSINKDKVNIIMGDEVLSRQDAKTVFYATIFGGGAPRIMSILGSSRAVAQAVIDAFNNVLPELPDLKNILNSIRRDKGYVPALDGRPLYIRSPHMTLVSLMQGDEAVAMEYSMCWLDREIKRRGFDAHQLIYYHDEIQMEARSDQADQVGKTMEEAIAWPGDILGLNVPLTGSYSKGESWADSH